MEANTTRVTAIEKLFVKHAEVADPAVISLENSRREPVAALYLDQLDISSLTVLERPKNTGEKYYLVLNGIAVFFTYFKQI